MQKEYIFTAKNIVGNTVCSKIKASSEKEAVDLLTDRRLRNIQFKKNSLNRTFKEDFFLKHSYRVNIKDKLFAFIQIRTFLRSGITLVTAIKNISVSHPNKRFRAILHNIYLDLSAGETLSDCFSKYPDVFSPLVNNLIKTGEESGKSELVFNKISDYLENMNSLKSAISSAMMYPIFLLFFMFIIISFMLWKIIPTFKTMYQNTGSEFPLPTKIVLYLSDFVINNYGIILLVIIFTISLFKFIKRYKFVKQIIDKLLINLFIFGPIVRLIVISRIMSTISLMLDSGLPILNAIRTSGKVSNNEVYSKAMDKIASDISAGKDIALSFKETKRFPVIVFSFLETAEKTGTIDEMTNKISEYYETESKYKIKEFSSIMEPLLLIVLGLITALLVVSIYLPIMTFGESFQTY